MGKSIPAWREPRLTYSINDGVTADDFERIEGNMLNLRNTGRPYGTATGQDTYGVSIASIPECEEFISIGVMFQKTNTKAKPTVNLNSLGAHELVKSDGSAFGPHEIVPNIWYLIIYNKSRWQALGTVKASFPYGESHSLNGGMYTADVPGVGEYIPGFMVTIKFSVNCASGATININDLGAVPIRKFNGQLLEAGEIGAGNTLTLVYNNSSWNITSPMQYTPMQSVDNVYAEVFHGTRTTGDEVYQVDLVDVELRALQTKLLVNFHKGNDGPVFLRVGLNSPVEVRTVDGLSLPPETLRDGETHLLVYDGVYFLDLTPFGSLRTVEQRTIDIATTQIKLISDVAVLMGSHAHGSFAGILNLDFKDLSGITLTSGIHNPKKQTIFI